MSTGRYAYMYSLQAVAPGIMRILGIQAVSWWEASNTVEGLLHLLLHGTDVFVCVGRSLFNTRALWIPGSATLGPHVLEREWWSSRGERGTFCRGARSVNRGFSITIQLRYYVAI